VVIDYRVAPDLARKFDVIDPETGDDLNYREYYFVDDQSGRYGRYLRNDNGTFRMNEAGQIETEEGRGRFKLIRREE
jgi:hypothetical protein